MARAIMVAATVLFLGLALGGPAAAQQAEGSAITVGEIALVDLRWGPQEATIDITNNADYPKLVSVVCDVSFTGTYLNPVRSSRTNYLLPSGVQRTLREHIFIPGNYGKADVVFRIYAVVDTLDVLMDYQEVARQPFAITYHIPEPVQQYFQEPMSFPPLVDGNSDFDYEFARLLPLLMNEGKTVDEIAALVMCDTGYVSYTLDKMAKSGYFLKHSGEYSLRFPVITTPEAEESKALAEKFSDELADMVEARLPAVKQTMADMVQKGIIESNADDFFHGGSLLYYTYPLVAGPFFWYDLGQRFINPDKPLEIYAHTDFCDTRLPRYMYAVHGGAFYNGTHFFFREVNRGDLELTFADSVPEIVCTNDVPDRTKLAGKFLWNWGPNDAPEPFVLDTAIVNKILVVLGADSDELLSRINKELKAVADKYGNDRYGVGMRYWFWNLTASRTLIKLQKRGVLTRHGHGIYRYEEV